MMSRESLPKRVVEEPCAILIMTQEEVEANGVLIHEGAQRTKWPRIVSCVDRLLSCIMQLHDGAGISRGFMWNQGDISVSGSESTVLWLRYSQYSLHIVCHY